MPHPYSSISRRNLLAGGLALATLAAVQPALADGSFPEPGPFPPRDALLTYADMIKALEKIERTSKGAVQVTTLRELGISPGVSEAGRDLYVATVGTGDTHVWLQGRIHGNEPYGTDTMLDVLKSVGSNGNPTFRRIRDELTLHVIPMYNPDGSELYIRHTVLQDGSGRRIDLNRDWAPNAFQAKESIAWYTYWNQVKPDYGLDIHHQGLKYADDGEPITMSLGISLAPSGPTLPGVKGGLYDVQTRQMQGQVYSALQGYGFVNIDRYSVGGGGNFYEIDIRGGVASAVMIGLNWQDMNPTGHSHPMVFFETYGGSIGQKSRGKAIEQNVRGTVALLEGLATGSTWGTDPLIWHDQIPHVPFVGYQTDGGLVTPWPAQGPVTP
ncbi:Tat (twin-arginine translocation) pathway signal sequence [Ornithinimicrobium ciconiae]|uniref:Tat (Twin-arginine translocation) pathway signal sequence n=1 Tax=Ornithinimicrobium ciconiae TaxID=2594265 RepID=A0A516G9M4_9MICO|nr:M14 family zinc carboxypeptidase [Ornithinimicrobium ciconiae]QDO88192.1 Tat (twin-arginine translocation) pathway signal sequence [Ornithinimicrobium ciconiae]